MLVYISPKGPLVWGGDATTGPGAGRYCTRALPPLQDVAEVLLVLEAWCWHLPLLGNPLLTKACTLWGKARERPAVILQQLELQGCRALCTLGDAVHTREDYNPIMRALGQTRLAVQAACMRQSTISVATNLTAIYCAIYCLTGLLWSGCSPVG